MTATDCACGRVVEYQRLENGARAVVLVESQEDVTAHEMAASAGSFLLGVVMGTPLSALVLWLWFVKPWRRGWR